MEAIRRAMTGYSFQTLHSDGGAHVIFRGVVGSRAYGTDRPGHHA